MSVIRLHQNNNNLAIAYYRYSSAAQDAISIERQRDAVCEYAKERGLSIVAEYKDEARSGTDDNRPGFQKMLQEVFQLKPAWLLLWSSSRLGRDVADVRAAKKVLLQAGCFYDYVSETTPSFTPDGMFMDGILDLNNQKYSDTLSVDIRSGIQKKAKLCRYQGNPIYGYKAVSCTDDPKSKIYEIDEHQVTWVRYMFATLANDSDVTLADVCKTLNDAGERTSRGGLWTVSTLSRVLKMEQYKGVYVYAGIRVEGGMPRIIDDDVFEAVSRRLFDNRRLHAHKIKEKVSQMGSDSLKSHSSRDYWLSPYLVCGCCGDPMSGGCGTSKTGKSYAYYRCNGKIRHKGCKKKNVPAHILEDIVSDVLYYCVNDSEHAVEIVLDAHENYEKSHANNEDQLSAMKSQLKKTEGEIKNLIDTLAQLGSSASVAVLEAIESRQVTCDRLSALIEVKESKAKHIDKGSLDAYWSRYFQADVSDSKTRDELMRFYVKSVIAYDDRVVVRMTYDDGDGGRYTMSTDSEGFVNAYPEVVDEFSKPVDSVRELSHHLQTSRFCRP